MTLVAHKPRLAVFRAIVAVAALIAVDQVVLAVGDSVVASPHWPDNLLPRMVRATDTDVLVVGTCRAAQHLDPAILQRETGLRFFNAGRVVDGLGNIELTLNIALAHLQPRYVMVVLDDGVWDDTLEVAREELWRRRLFWTLMPLGRLASLSGIYGTSMLWLSSGLFKYAGQGTVLLKAFEGVLRGEVPPPTDGYQPRPAERSLVDQLRDEKARAQMERSTLRSLPVNPFATNTVGRILDLIRSAGSRPLLVITPMHALRATESVNLQQAELVRGLATAHGASAFVFLGNDTAWATRAEYWSDTGHMNIHGAAAFSAELASRLRLELVAKTP
ncbi:MAG: hypothetical protein AB2A00_10945 [Myxococcota bacterium]